MQYSDKYGLVTKAGFRVKEFHFENGTVYGQIFKNDVYYGSIDSFFGDRTTPIGEIVDEYKKDSEKEIRENYQKLQAVFNKF